MRVIYLMLILGLVSILVSCSDDTTTNPPGPVVDIIPLEIGNTWIYNVKALDFLGNVTGIYIDTVQIIGRFEKNGINWFKKFSYHNKDVTLIYNKPEGLWLTSEFSAKAPHIQALYPAKKNEIFRKEITGINGLDTNWHESRVAGVNETVTVSGKNYSCYKYEHSMFTSGKETFDEMIYLVSYYSPGIGVVKEVSIFFESREIKRFPGRIYELIEFKKLPVD